MKRTLGSFFATVRLRYVALATVAAGLAIAAACIWADRSREPVTPDAAAFPVRGIDVSAHNGDIDFERVAADGVRFVLIKASEGHSFKDKRFVDNYNGARRAGLKVGAYHFFRFDCTGYMQALNLLHSVRGRPVDLPLVIDIEEWSNPRDHSARDVMLRLSEMVGMLEAHGYDVMLYSNRDGFERFLSERFAHYPLWICSMTSVPAAEDLAFWQFSHRGRVDGIKGDVDLNVFNGDSTAFAAWSTPAGRR